MSRWPVVVVEVMLGGWSGRVMGVAAVGQSQVFQGCVSWRRKRRPLDGLPVHPSRGLSQTLAWLAEDARKPWQRCRCWLLNEVEVRGHGEGRLSVAMAGFCRRNLGLASFGSPGSPTTHSRLLEAAELRTLA